MYAELDQSTAFDLPRKLLACITEHLDLAGLVAEAVHPQAAHDLVHRFAGRLVFVEKVACKKDHVDIAFAGQAHDFVESFPAVIAPDRVAFGIADMVVRGDEDAYRVRRCVLSVARPSCAD